MLSWPDTNSYSGVRADGRRQSRVPIALPARYLSSDLTIDGQVTNVSSEGLFFHSEFLDKTGERASIWVNIPARPAPLELRGEVRWVEEQGPHCGMGIRLVDLSTKDHVVLTSLIRAATPIEDRA